MPQDSTFSITVFEGDGIGREVMASALRVIEAARQRIGGFRLDLTPIEAGAAFYQSTGVALRDEDLRVAEQADAILFGAMGLPDVRYPDGTEIAPQLDMRFAFELYAGVRPIRAIPGLSPILTADGWADIDFVIIRESTEGLFASRGKGVVEDDAVARDTMVITRDVSERLFDFSFKLARQRQQRGGQGRVTCVDKANVFTSQAFFRKIFDETATRYDDLNADHHYIDATALDLVRKPWTFDVMVMENQFGDIISDLGAALIGGMGMAPSADIGDKHGMFQPSHGSAPDIAGQGIANPTGMILSAAMMLDWLGTRHDSAPLIAAAELIDGQTRACLASKSVQPVDLGGADGTAAITDAVCAAINTAS